MFICETVQCEDTAVLWVLLCCVWRLWNWPVWRHSCPMSTVVLCLEAVKLTSVKTQLPYEYCCVVFAGCETDQCEDTAALWVLLCCVCRLWNWPVWRHSCPISTVVLCLQAVKLTSVKTQLPYEYYSLPFCKPEGDLVYKSENLGM